MEYFGEAVLHPLAGCARAGVGLVAPETREQLGLPHVPVSYATGFP